jgi:hypothetical protein
MRRLIVAWIVVVAVVTVTSIPTAPTPVEAAVDGEQVAGPDPAWVCGARTKETLEAARLIKALCGC